MSKSRARFLAELLNSDGRVRPTVSALAGGDGIIDLEVLPILPNSQLEHSSISIAGHSLSLGASLSLDTSDITEHASYLYYTDARVRGALSVSGSLAYNSSTGVISFTTPTTIASLSNHDTDDLSEGGTNLYYTSARANSDFDTRFGIKTTADLSEGTNLYWTTARGNSNFTTNLAASDTDDLSEGATNLYYTSARGNSDFDTRFGIKTTADLSEGTNLYYTDGRVGSYLTTNSYATQTYVNTAVSNLVDSAPGTLDTLNELAAALGDDPNFATTVSNQIGTKWTQDNTKISNWDTAYSWGNHASVGYLTGNQTITLTGDVSGSGTTSISVTIADDSHNHIISNVDGLQGALNGKLASSSYTASDVLTKIKTVDGSGSGLDADLLDGVQGASFLRSDAADTFTGTLTMGTQVALVANNYGRGVFGLYSASRYQHVWSMGAAYKTSNNGTSFGNIYGLTYTHTNVGTGTNQAIAGLSHQLQHRTNGTLTAAIGTGIWTSGTISSNPQGTLWGASNDGSGSGLDADTLDGLQLHTGRNNVANRVVRTNSSGYADFGWINTTSGATTGTNRIYASNDGYIRYVTPATLRSNLGLWWTGNDGSGSGLDADLLDGVQAASFLRSDTTDTMSGRLEMAAVLDMNNNDIYGVDQIFHHGDTNTYMQFHASDQWRVVTGGSERLEVNNTNTTVKNNLIVNGNFTVNGIAGGSISTATNSGAVNYVYSSTGGTPTRGSCGTHIYHQWSNNLVLNLSNSSWQRGDVVVVKNVRGAVNITVSATRIYLPNGSYDTSVTFNGTVGSFTLIKYSTSTGYWMVGP